MFSHVLGCTRPVELKLNHNLNPINHRAHLIPFVLQGPVEEEIYKFVKQDVRGPVQSSQLVIVSFKSNGRFAYFGIIRPHLTRL